MFGGRPMARRVSRAMAVREAHKPKRRLHSPVRPPRAQRARPTGGRSPPRHPGGREAAGRTVGVSRQAGLLYAALVKATYNNETNFDFAPRLAWSAPRDVSRAIFQLTLILQASLCLSYESCWGQRVA
jgi:hypothetical protein